MHFLLGFLLGYYTRNKPLLAATLLGFALVCFIVLPAIALSGLALSVRRERLSRPPQTRVPQLVGLDYKTAETTLHNSKLNIRVLAHRYDPPTEPGKILFQTPQAGESVACGTVVGIVISKEEQDKTPVLPVLGQNATSDARPISNPARLVPFTIAQLVRYSPSTFQFRADKRPPLSDLYARAQNASVIYERKSRLTRSLGPSYLFVNFTVREIPIMDKKRAFPAIQIAQSGKRMFLTYMRGKDVVNGISKPDAWTPHNKTGYQRLPVQSRFRKIARYLMGKEGADPLLPQAVLLNVRDKGMKFIPTNGQEVGILEIPESVTLYEVDGQHRFGGIRYAVEQDPKLAEFQVPVVITEGLPLLNEAVLFFLVNTEQKRVSTDLAQRLIEQQMEDEGLRLQIVASGKDWIPKATKIVDSLLSAPDNPWTNKIGIPGLKISKVPMKQVSFVSSLKPILTNPIYGHLEPEDMGKLLLRYWEALNEVYSEAIADPEEHVIQKTAGVFPLHMIATEVFEMVRTAHGRITKEALVEVFREMDASISKEFDGGSLFWHRRDGEAGKYGGAKGFRIIADILRQHLPKMKRVKVV